MPTPLSLPRWHRPLRWPALRCGVWMIALLCMAWPAHADVYDDVERSILNQQWDEALKLANERLQSHSRDPQMRLLMSRIQTSRNQIDEAMQTLILLTQDFPELPEPHNNLAVLYARAERFDDARNALLAALRARPDYATALENLGDLYLVQARDAYRRALQAAPALPALMKKSQAVQAILPDRPQ